MLRYARWAGRSKQRNTEGGGKARNLSLGEYPPDLTCCVCFGLFVDPVAWPGSEQCKAHPVCRSCLIRSAETRTCCPVCRAPPPPGFYLGSLWTLNSIDAIEEQIQQSYPERLPHEQHRFVDITSLPLFEEFDAQSNHKSIRPGTTTTWLLLRESRHFLLLAQSMANLQRGAVRFALLSTDQARGYIAGLFDLTHFNKCKTPRQAMAHLLAYHASTRMEQPNLWLKVVIVDTFQLAGAPTEVPIEAETYEMINKTNWRMTEGSKPLRQAPLVRGSSSHLCA